MTKRIIVGALAAILSVGGGTRLSAVESDPGFRPSSQQIPAVNTEALLENSHISYRADGGFTVEGIVSVVKSISDPRLGSNAVLRQMGNLTEEQYLNLWNELTQLAVLGMPDARGPIVDIHDEFTVNFETQVDDSHHQFKAYGLSRPEAARHFAVRSVIDRVVGMDFLWNQHREQAAGLSVDRSVQP